MKLSAHYSKATLIITFSVLFIAGIIYYCTITYIVNNQLDRDLKEEVEEISDFVKLNQHLPGKFDFEDDQITLTKTNEKLNEIDFYDAPYYKRRHNNKPG